MSIGLISQKRRLKQTPVSPESFTARQKSTVLSSPYGFYEYLPEGYDQAPAASIPLLIFLHGSDERGNGNSELNKVLTWGIPKQQNAGTWHHNFIGLSPQWLGANDDNYYRPEDLKSLITYAKTNYKVDPNRIYLTGVSAGTWLLMYYLQNYPTDHEVAASVILSGNAYVDYTDPALIAAANSPIWMMSNISDPLVPWSTNSLPNISVINTRNGINAVTTGMVEKLTGFVNSTHTDTWDGIYDSSLIGTASSSYDQFDEPIYDWMLEHQYVPSIEKIIAVNFTDTAYTQAPTPWNNIHYSNPTTTGANLIDTTGTPTTISLSSISSFNGSSDELYSGTLPIPEIYNSDWWGSDSAPPIQLVMSGFDVSKKYKFKIIGSIESTGITKYNLVNDDTTAISMGSSFPNSADLTSDTNYVVLNGEGQTSYTIYGWRVADQYKSLIALIIEEVSEEPVQRVFTVGTGSGNLTIDGTDNTKPWYPLQSGDTFEIQGGTYSSITTVNLVGQQVVIKNVDNQTITSNFLYVNSPQKDVQYNFANNGSVAKGLTLIMESQDTMHIDRSGLGNMENISMYGIKYSVTGSTPDGGIFLRHSQDATTVYNNGAGTTSLKDFLIEDIEFDFTPNSGMSPWYLMSFNRGGLSTSIDNNFIDGITIRNIRATGGFFCATAIEIKNCQRALVDDIYFDSLNNNWTSSPPHARIILIQGQGIIENCYMRDGMGNVAVIWGYNRLANNAPSIIRNCLSFNSFRYSTAEIQGYSDLIVSGVSKAPHYKMLGLVADTLDTGNYFSGCAGDIYPLLGGTFEARNSVSINGHSNNSGQNNPFNNMAGAGTISNNTVYANRTLAGVADETYIPQTGSPLIGAGIANVDLVEDYNGVIRPNPPSIGACEPN